MARPGEEKAVDNEKKVEKDTVYVDITIDLPPFTSIIRVDGREYQQGLTYKFREEQVASIKDIIARAWGHEQEVRGERKPFDPSRRYGGRNFR